MSHGSLRVTAAATLVAAASAGFAGAVTATAGVEPPVLAAPGARGPGSVRAGASAPVVHEIPADVTVLAFVRPRGHRLEFLVRVPLVAMRDFDFPLRGAGYLDIPGARPLLRAAATTWIADYVRFYEGREPLDAPSISAIRLSLPSDRSFTSWETARAHVTGPPLADDTGIVWEQVMLDVEFEYRIASDSARFSIDPALAHLGLRTVTVLRFRPPGGAERAFQYTGDPGLVRLDPRWHQAALRFVELGFRHILDGLDHLLFLLCLVIPVRRLRDLLPVITSFTVAHSITLIASASGLAPGALWFPPLIETLIALSIVYMAIENIVGARRERRWMLAFGFGLVHGFGFSFALRDTLQFAGSHLLASLLSFNLGVELGQVVVVAMMIPLLELLFRRVVAERMGTIILSAFVAHTAWHWMTARGSTLLRYEFRWPAWDLALLAAAMRGLLLVLVIGGAGWLLRGWVRRLAAGSDRATGRATARSASSSPDPVPVATAGEPAEALR